MWYVMVQDSYSDARCVGEYDSVNDALERSEMFEDAWVCSDEEEDAPEDWCDECGFDPYMGEYSFDC